MVMRLLEMVSRDGEVALVQAEAERKARRKGWRRLEEVLKEGF
jgi:hypothetical protein